MPLIALSASSLLRASLGAALMVFACGPASAQDAAGYPAKPVTLVVPLAPGGPVDVEARVYSQKLTELMGQPFVLDYKVGAGGGVGIAYVAKAAPDGYTLLTGSTGLTIIPALNKNAGFDIGRDFAPISLMTKKPSVLIVSAALPVKSLPELLAYAKAHPNELNFGTTGSGGAIDLAGKFLVSVTDLKMTFVHYKGTAPFTVDLMAGRVHVGISNLISAMSLVKEGKLRVLGVTTLTRQPRMPDVPTLTESGAPGYEYVGWTGFLAPARTPPAIINKLSAEMAKMARAPDVLKKLGDSDVELVGSSPDYMRKYVLAEFARWQKVVQDAGLKLEE